MRLNKILAIAALTTVAASIAAAQTVVRISAYVGPNQVAHQELGPRDTAGAGPYPALIQGQLPTSGQNIYPLFLSVHPDPQWLTGGPNTANRWSTLSFSFTYDTNFIDLVFRDPNTGADVFVSSLNVGQIFSPFIDPRSPAVGTAAGQVNAKSGSLVTVTLALAHTSNTNGIAAAGAYLRDWFANDFDGELLRVRVNSDAIVANGNIYNTQPGVAEGNIIIQVTPSDSSRDVQVYGSFIVPEPASMIALGSGLVGLLALRRRKK